MSRKCLETLVRQRAGLDMASLGANAFDTAITSRMRTLGIDTQAAYADRVAADEAEWAQLLEVLLVSESWFFRGGRPLFDFLARELLNTSARENRTARALSIPCGIGEEPYSLAIALHDLGASASIEGWDLSPAHVAQAETGRFTAFSFRETDPAVRDRAFRSVSAKEWQVIPAIRDRVRFRECNLSQDAGSSTDSFDVVFCRNVFIYLTEPARKQAIANLERWLAPDGLLCLSPAEADRLPRGKFTRVGPEGSLIYRRETETKSLPSPPPRKTRSGVRKALAAPVAKPTRPSVAPTPVPVRDPLVTVRELADRGELVAALASCQSFVKSSPPSADAFGLLGVLHAAHGNATGAVDAFTKALYLKPDHAESLEHLAVISEQRGDRNRAAAFRRRLTRATGGSS